MSDQSSFGMQAKGFAGQMVGFAHSNRGRAYCNDTGYERQVIDVNITATNSHAYAFTVAGVTVSFTSDSTATTTEVRDGLIANARSQQALEYVSFEPNGSAIVRTIVKAAGTAVTVAEADGSLTLTTVQAATAPQPIPFGLAVVKRTGTGTTDRSCRLPSALADKFLGIAERSPQLTNPVAPDDKIAPGMMMTVGTNGLWYATVEVAVAAEDPVYWRATAGTGTVLGSWRNDADTVSSVDTAVLVVGAKFKTSAVAGALAELRLNG